MNERRPPLQTLHRGQRQLFVGGFAFVRGNYYFERAPNLVLYLALAPMEESHFLFSPPFTPTKDLKREVATTILQWQINRREKHGQWQMLRSRIRRVNHVFLVVHLN